MNATMTYDTIAINPARSNRRSLLSALRRFFHAMLKVNAKAPYDLPADMAARLYL